jgi:hypothetical protein
MRKDCATTISQMTDRKCVPRPKKVFRARCVPPVSPPGRGRTECPARPIPPLEDVRYGDRIPENRLPRRPTSRHKRQSSW